MDTKTGEKFGTYDTYKGTLEKMYLKFKENEARNKREIEEKRREAQRLGNPTFRYTTAVYDKACYPDRTNYRPDVYDTATGEIIYKGSKMF